MRYCCRIILGSATLLKLQCTLPYVGSVFIVTFAALRSFPEPSETENQTLPSHSAPSWRWFRSKGSLAPAPCKRIGRTMTCKSNDDAYHCLPSFSVTTLDLESQKFAQTMTVGSLAPYLHKNLLAKTTGARLILTV